MKQERRQIIRENRATGSDKTASSAPESHKISHREILARTAGYPQFVAGYHQQVLPQKTRTIRLLGQKCPAIILTTLLGYEVQMQYKRVQCPDLVTARYIRLFAELGFLSIRLPYDPTLTARLIPAFETAIEAINRQIRERFPDDVRLRNYVTRKVYAIIRRDLRKKPVSTETPCAAPEDPVTASPR